MHLQKRKVLLLMGLLLWLAAGLGTSLTLCRPHLYMPTPNLVQPFTTKMTRFPDSASKYQQLSYDLETTMKSCARSNDDFCLREYILKHNLYGDSHTSFGMLSELLYDIIINLTKNTKDSTGNAITATFYPIYLQSFLSQFPNQPEQMKQIVRQFGAVGVLSVGWIGDRIVDGRFNPPINSDASPYSHIAELFRTMSTLYDRTHSLPSPERLRTDLERLASALLIAGAQGDEESFKRVGRTVEIVARLLEHDNAWTLQRIGHPTEYSYRAACGRTVQRYIDSIATAPKVGVKGTTAYVIAEPFLQARDVIKKLPEFSVTRPDGIVTQELKKTVWLSNYRHGLIRANGTSFKGRGKRLIVIDLKAADDDALTQLKHQLQAYSKQENSESSSLTFLIVLDGQVVYSVGQKSDNADQLCQSLGLCDPQTADADTDTTDDSSSQDDSDDDDGSSFTVIGTVTDDCDQETSVAKLCAEGFTPRE